MSTGEAAHCTTTPAAAAATRTATRSATRGGARSAAALSAVISAAMLAAACASPAPPKPYYQTRTYQAYARAQPAIVGCLIAKHVIPQRDVSGAWFRNGTVNSNAAFAGWLLSHGQKRYGGQALDAWIDQARRDWPSSYCGPSPEPAATP